jgi:YD repeat-containing protein
VEKKPGVTSLESESYTYDSNGNTLTYTDKDNLTTTYAYTNNHVATVTDPKGTTVTYSYDTSNGTYNLLGDGKNTYTYYPLGTAENGALYTSTDSEGITLTYEYTNGYVTRITKSGSTTPTEESTYDEAGRLLSKTSDGKTITYQYTLYDKASQVTETVGSESSPPPTPMIQKAIW